MDDGEEEEEESEEEDDYRKNRLDSIIEEDDEEATEYQRSRSRGKSRGSSNSLGREPALRGSISKRHALFAPQGKPPAMKDETLSLS